MTFEKPLIISNRYILGFNFLFNADLKPVFICDFVQSVDYPHQFILISTGENYCFTFECCEPYFGNRLLPWPSYGQLKKEDGLCRIYPLSLIDAAQEEKILIEHIWQTYIRHIEHEEGKKNVLDFLEFQYKNNVQGKPQDFIDTVQRALFVDGGLIVAGFEESIEMIRLRALLWEWLRNRRDELIELLGDKYYSKLESGEIVEKKVSPNPSSWNEIEKSELTAAQYIIIEYLKNDKKLNPNGLTLASYVAKLARNYSPNGTAFRELLKGMKRGTHRIAPYLTIKDLTEGQFNDARKNYSAVLQHFENENNTALIEEVRLILTKLH